MKINRTITDCLVLAVVHGVKLTWDDIVGWDDLNQQLWVSFSENGERRIEYFSAQDLWEYCGGDGFAEFVTGEGFFPDLIVFDDATDHRIWCGQRLAGGLYE